MPPAEAHSMHVQTSLEVSVVMCQMILAIQSLALLRHRTQPALAIFEDLHLILQLLRHGMNLIFNV